MRVIDLQRGMGKTHKLISEHFLGKSSILFVMNHSEKKRLIRVYNLSESDSDRIYSFNNGHIKEMLMGIGEGDIIIDNVDIFLNMIFERVVSVVTVSR